MGYGSDELFAETSSFFEMICVGLVVKLCGLAKCAVIFLSS